MATLAHRLDSNVSGDLYVDSSCIDCGACRWIAPHTFNAQNGYSTVYAQPKGDADVSASLRALVSCPTASIGTVNKQNTKAAAASFPYPLADGVYHCGFHSEDSYGAASYVARGTALGNVLVDSPRFSQPLARQLEAVGGVDLIFLSHRDDVADHNEFAKRFSAERILHRDDVTATTRVVERQPEGLDPVALSPDLLLIPTPGHTRGSACLLWQEKYLFTGDHLAWSPAEKRLNAFRRACWFDWDTQTESMRRLAEFRFEAVLPGHGSPVFSTAPVMQEAMLRLVDWMASA